MCPVEIKLTDEDGPFFYPTDLIERVEIHPTYEETGGIVYFDGGTAKIDHENLLEVIPKPTCTENGRRFWPAFSRFLGMSRTPKIGLGMTSTHYTLWKNPY